MKNIESVNKQFTEVINDPVAPPLLLQGYDQFADKPRNTFLAGDTFPGSTQIVMNYAVCTSTEEVHNALNVSASLAYSGLNGSGNAKADFMNTLSISKTGIYVVVYVHSILNAWTTNNVTLGINGLPPENTEEAINSFYSTYGNAYVSEVSVGGWYAAVYSYQSSTIEEQTSFQSQLSAKGIVGTGTLSADICTSLSNYMKLTNVAISFDQHGDGIKRLPNDADDIYAYAQDFTASVNYDHPAVLNFKCTSYRHVSGMPSKMAELDRLYNNFSTGDISYSSRYANTAALNQWLIKIAGIFRQYEYTGDLTLQNKLDDVKEDIRTINQFLQDITFAPLPLTNFPLLNSDAWGAPSFNIGQGLGQLGAGGISGDQAISDVSIANVSNQTHIKTLGITYGGTINTLTLGFVSSDRQWTSQYGQRGGDQSIPTYTFLDSERITSVSTQVDETTNVISFTTSAGVTLSATGENNYGTSNSWTETANTRLIGFVGSYGWYVNQLQVLYAVFSPIKWSNEKIAGRDTLNISIGMTLPIPYYSDFVEIDYLHHEIKFCLRDGEHVARSQFFDIGLVKGFKSKRLLGQFEFRYQFDMDNRVITVCGTDYESAGNLCLTTVPEGTTEYCRERACGSGLNADDRTSNLHWNYTTALTPGLKDLLSNVVRSANDRLITELKNQPGLNVQVKMSPPKMSAQDCMDFMVVYRNGVFQDFYKPGENYGPEDTVYTLDSVFGGEVTLYPNERFANVIGSSTDPKIAGLSWIRLWANQFGGYPSICTSYHLSGFGCGNTIFGGHVIAGNSARYVNPGSNSVWILPICVQHNNDDSVYMEALTNLRGVWLNNYLGT